MPCQGNTRYRLICLMNIPSASPIHVLENGPIQLGAGCLSNKLESNLHIHFSPFYSGRRGFEKGITGSRFNDNYTTMADTNMVSRVTQNVCQEPTPSSRKSGPSSGFSRKRPSSDSTKLSKTTSLVHLRESLQAEGMSERVITLITNFQRTSSHKH